MRILICFSSFVLKIQKTPPYYDIFSEAPAIFEENNIKLHFLCTWWDILEEVKLQKTFTSSTIKEVEKFLNSPREWQNERL